MRDRIIVNPPAPTTEAGLLGEEIRDYCDESGYSLRKVAAAIGVHGRVLSDAINGRLSMDETRDIWRKVTTTVP